MQTRSYTVFYVCTWKEFKAKKQHFHFIRIESQVINSFYWDIIDRINNNNHNKKQQPNAASLSKFICRKSHKNQAAITTTGQAALPIHWNRYTSLQWSTKYMTPMLTTKLLSNMAWKMRQQQESAADTTRKSEGIEVKLFIFLAISPSISLSLCVYSCIRARWI